MFAKDCTYCDGFLRPAASEKDSPWNAILLESESFVVVPTIGMMVPGWVLIMPKSHYLNLGSLPREMLIEFEALKEETRRALTVRFAPPVFFEHGPGKTGHPAGSCIDHAHMHAVPGNFDLVPKLASKFDWRPIGGLLELRNFFANSGAYLFFESREGSQRVCAAPDVPSQYFRRIIAKEIGQEDHWDWAVFQGGENLQATLKKFKNARDQVGAAQLTRKEL